MNARYTLMNDTFRAWVAALEDTNLMREWKQALEDRIKFVDDARELTKEELVDGLKRSVKGDILYATKRVRMGEDLYPSVYFYQWMPRKKVLWVTSRRCDHYRELQPGELRAIALDSVYFHQLARTEVAVRRRVPVTPKKATKAKAKQELDGNQADLLALDDIPF